MSADKMPPLPAYVYGRETAANERLIPLGDAEAWRDSVRAYAAEQTRELVGALQAICDEQDAQQGYATPETYDKARAAIAKATGGQQ